MDEDVDFKDLLTIEGADKFFLTVALYGEGVFNDAVAWVSRTPEENEQIIIEARKVANI